MGQQSNRNKLDDNDILGIIKPIREQGGRKQLDIRNNRMGIFSFDCIRKTLSLPNKPLKIASIDASYSTALTPLTMEKIIEIIEAKVDCLQEIVLQNCQITDVRGLVQAFANNPHLLTLDLKNNPAQDRQPKQYSRLQRLSTLHQYIDRCIADPSHLSQQNGLLIRANDTAAITYLIKNLPSTALVDYRGPLDNLLSKLDEIVQTGIFSSHLPRPISSTSYFMQRYRMLLTVACPTISGLSKVVQQLTTESQQGEGDSAAQSALTQLQALHNIPSQPITSQAQL